MHVILFLDVYLHISEMNHVSVKMLAHATAEANMQPRLYRPQLDHVITVITRIIAPFALTKKQYTTSALPIASKSDIIMIFLI